ncbi:MAG TPA: histidinol-phosphate transaminase [Actinomycetota bacterium]|nr:histidinol-phosphate transaminase [Actinomycetota bacterium]
MRSLSPEFRAYEWAPSTAELARRTGIDEDRILRFDANVPPRPSPAATPETIAAALDGINEYAHGGYPELVGAIAHYAGVEPRNVVLGAGADDLILLCARAFAGPGDRVSIAYEPTYPLYRSAAWLAGAEIGDDAPAVTFCCRPHNPTGALVDLPAARPLVVDEAYAEFAGVSAIASLRDGVVVLRTFSKVFGLAGARVGYALADDALADELNARQAPLPVARTSAALALAALRDPPDVAPFVRERERVERALRDCGLEPLPSCTNFLFLPVPDPHAVASALLADGLVVRALTGGVRFNVRTPDDDDRLVDALARALARPVRAR